MDLKKIEELKTVMSALIGTWCVIRREVFLVLKQAKYGSIS